MSTWTLAVSTLITADRRIEGFLLRNAEKLRGFDEVLIVCQGVEKAPEFAPGLMPLNCRIVICERRGISASRNAAIAALATDIVWFMDDDTVLSDNLAAIKQAISDSPAEINTLRIQDCDSENLFKAYPPEGDIGSLGLLRVSSIETAHSEPRWKYQPGHPDAVKEGPRQGWVAYPNIDMTTEFVGNPEASAKILEAVPLKRFGEVADVAHAVAYLCSEEAGYVTGQVFAVDGGMAM